MQIKHRELQFSLFSAALSSYVPKVKQKHLEKKSFNHIVIVKKNIYIYIKIEIQENYMNLKIINQQRYGH